MYYIFQANTPTIYFAPSFDQILNVKKTHPKLNCLDFLQLSTTTFVIDCQIQKNTFFLLIQDTEETQTPSIPTTYVNRALGTYKNNDMQTVLRVTFSIINDSESSNDSFVELFKFIDGQLQAWQTLDKALLSNISGKNVHELNIVDFKSGLNGSIYLLDAKIGIFIVNFDKEWKFQKLITFIFGQKFAFDRTLLNSKEEVFVIQGYNNYIIIDSEGQIKKVQNLQFNSITYSQTISASSNFIFIEHQALMYVYHTDNNNSGLIDIIDLTNNAVIVNPIVQRNRKSFSSKINKMEHIFGITHIIKIITIVRVLNNKYYSHFIILIKVIKLFYKHFLQCY